MNPSREPSPHPDSGAADLQLALDEMRDGVILWSADGRVLASNAAVIGALMGLPPASFAVGARRLDVMTDLARRGDYGASDDPEGLARRLSDGFAAGEVTSLTRRLPDGRGLLALSRPLADGRLLVTYREAPAPDGAQGPTRA